MENLTSLFSYYAIMSLPWAIKGPGLVIIGLFIYRAVKNILQFSMLSTVAALFWAFAVGVLLTRFGRPIANMFGV